MYTVALRRDFVAQHYLVGGDWGRENDWHSHRYGVELRLEGDRLDGHGFLVDLVDVEARVAAQVERFSDRTLNDDSAFAGLNPSVEHFARILAEAIAGGGDGGPEDALAAPNLVALTVTVWEDDRANASFRHELAGGGAPAPRGGVAG